MRDTTTPDLHDALQKLDEFQKRQALHFLWGTMIVKDPKAVREAIKYATGERYEWEVAE